MPRHIISFLCLILIVLFSCQSNEEYISEVNATLKLSSTENNVWRAIGTRAATSTNDFYYVLDANSICKTAVGETHGTPHNSEKLLQTGTYTVFCITNVDPSGIRFESSMIGADYSTQTMVINTLTDVCLGQQPLNIVPSKTIYDINVPVNHILAKLTLSIASVPADIEAIAVTLTNVSKTFYLDGTFAEDGTTQTLDLQTADTPNADGTYNWTFPESLIYPCQSGATTTIITIVATDTNGNEHTYTSTTTTVCSSGTRTNLATTWRTLVDNLSYGYTENPWTTTIQQGSFDM